jgi:hypothetical protein
MNSLFFKLSKKKKKGELLPSMFVDVLISKVIVKSMIILTWRGQVIDERYDNVNMRK